MCISESMCSGNEISTGKYPKLYSWFLAYSQSCICVLTKQGGKNWNGNYFKWGIVKLLYKLPYTHFGFEIQTVWGVADATMYIHSSNSDFNQVEKIQSELCLVDLHNCTSEILKW